MRLVPTQRLVLLALAPLLLGVGMALDPALLGPTLAADGALILLALIDGLLAAGRDVSVERETAPVWSVGRANQVRTAPIRRCG